MRLGTIKFQNFIWQKVENPFQSGKRHHFPLVTISPGSRKSSNLQNVKNVFVLGFFFPPRFFFQKCDTWNRGRMSRIIHIINKIKRFVLKLKLLFSEYKFFICFYEITYIIWKWKDFVKWNWKSVWLKMSFTVIVKVQHQTGVPNENSKFVRFFVWPMIG